MTSGADVLLVLVLFLLMLYAFLAIAILCDVSDMGDASPGRALLPGRVSSRAIPFASSLTLRVPETTLRAPSPLAPPPSPAPVLPHKDYLVPALVRICQRFRIPDEAAGASLLAFGSSAPEIVISIVSISGGHETSDLGLTSVLGSAIIAFGLIPPLVVFYSPNRLLELRLLPFARDLLFFLVSICLLLGFTLSTGEVGIPESLTLVCIYPLYLLCIYLPLRIWPANKGTLSITGGGGAAAMIGVEVEEAFLPTAAGDSSDDKDDDGDNELDGRQLEAAGGGGESAFRASSSSPAPSSPSLGGCRACWDKALWVLSWPLALLLRWICPAVVDKGRTKHLYGLTFLLSLAYLALLSLACVEIAKVVSVKAGVPQFIEGAVILALGAQVPDALASVSMARQGLGGGALGNAIGSQVINVLLGFGLAAFMYSATNDGRPLSISGAGHGNASSPDSSSPASSSNSASAASTASSSASSASSASSLSGDGSDGSDGVISALRSVSTGDLTVMVSLFVMVLLYGTLACTGGCRGSATPSYLTPRKKRPSLALPQDRRPTACSPRLGAKAAVALVVAYVAVNIVFLVVAAVPDAGR